MTNWLKVSGDMARRIRCHDWSATPLGPIGTWPDVLRTALALCLDSRLAQSVMWGRGLIMLPNDAFSAILGNPPQALGRPFGVVYQEVWARMQPMAEQAWAGQAMLGADCPVLVERDGVAEQGYFTFCYSPIRDPAGQVIGLLNTVTETTATVRASQRLAFLDTLAGAAADATSPRLIMETITRMLGEHLRLCSCAYADLDADGNGLLVGSDWAAPGSPRFVGHYRLADFGPHAVSALRAGEPLVIQHHLAELAPSAVAAFQALGIGTTLCMPVLKHARLSALMVVNDRRPRSWSAHERALLDEATQYCWAHIERARAEMQLRELNENLERRVAKLLAQREASLLEQHEASKMETVGQLTGGIAHDFNNLLTPIMGTLELVRRRLDDKRSLELVDGALQAADRARTLVDQLLTFARRQTLKPRAVALEELVNDMRNLIDHSLGPTIEVTIDISSQLPTVMVDPHRLEVAILNLAVNSRDAMSEGGRLDISAAVDEVAGGKVKGLRAGRYTCLMVRDNGSGMSPETLKRCIDPFFSTKGVGKGSGLGLSMLQGLAVQSGGGLSITSQAGQGTRVSIWLPVTEGQAVQEEAVSSATRLAPGETSVLLVEDEDLVRQSTLMQLRDLGYQVTAAASAAAAVQLVEAGLLPDLLITDQLMAEKTGAQLAAELRQRIVDLPVLIITGYANLAPEQMQGFEVLSKPFRRAELAARVAQLIGIAGEA